MILLWGLIRDSPLARVRETLGDAAVFLDQADVLHMQVELCVDGAIQGTVRTPNGVISLDAVTAAYVRPYSSVQLPAISRSGPFSAAWHHAVNADDALMMWADLTSACVVNRPADMATNGAKPYQALFIQESGFHVPATLVTTDPAAVLEFWTDQAAVIYKSLSAVRSIVTRLEERHRARLANVRWCPTQFQEYVPGMDYRVHVVGDEVFACEIRSTADDYRYATRQGLVTDIRSYELPADIADRCRALTAALGMHVTGVDLRRHPDGRWYCFEVNPSPAFTYYQAATGQPIDKAIADLLMRAPATPERRFLHHQSMTEPTQ